jgi:hypothetical protein
MTKPVTKQTTTSGSDGNSKGVPHVHLPPPRTPVHAAPATPPPAKRNLSELCNSAELFRHVNNRDSFHFSRRGLNGETPPVALLDEFDSPMKKMKDMKMVKKSLSFGYKVSTR